MHLWAAELAGNVGGMTWVEIDPPPEPNREIIELLATRVADEGGMIRAAGWIAMPEADWIEYERQHPEDVPVRLRSGDLCVHVVRDPAYPKREQPSITCPQCGSTSYHPKDIQYGYCSNCHWWTSDPQLGPLFDEVQAQRP